jgi:hypothetical protein
VCREGGAHGHRHGRLRWQAQHPCKSRYDMSWLRITDLTLLN